MEFIEFLLYKDLNNTSDYREAHLQEWVCLITEGFVWENELLRLICLPNKLECDPGWLHHFLCGIQQSPGMVPCHVWPVMWVVRSSPLHNVELPAQHSAQRPQHWLQAEQENDFIHRYSLGFGKTAVVFGLSVYSRTWLTAELNYHFLVCKHGI